MSLFFDFGNVRQYQGDCRNMSEIASDSVHCVVTSPPYWSLRKYSGEQELDWQDGSHCALGLEPTPELFISHLVEIFREVKRVLRPDGVCWVNVGDSYAGSGQEYGSDHGKAVFRDGDLKKPERLHHDSIKPLDRVGIPEMLVLALRADGWYWRSTVVWSKPNPMPESVNGWRWERHRIKIGKGATSDKTHDEGLMRNDANRYSLHLGTGTYGQWRDCPGCPKCSANDGYILRKGSWRPTDSFEYIYLLTKTSSYYCDMEAVREPHSRDWGSESPSGYFKPGSETTLEAGMPTAHRRNDVPMQQNPAGRNLRSVWTTPERMLRLRGDLSEADRAYVLGELLSRGILSSTHGNGIGPTE